MMMIAHWLNPNIIGSIMTNFLNKDGFQPKELRNVRSNSH